MIGEIDYWRDLCRILEGITVELKLPEVELTVQIMVTWSEEKEKLKEDITSFTKNKSRVLKGYKEAKWNNKYMKIIEKPVV